jgi:hypothetical protein
MIRRAHRLSQLEPVMLIHDNSWAWRAMHPHSVHEPNSRVPFAQVAGKFKREIRRACNLSQYGGISHAPDELRRPTVQ